MEREIKKRALCNALLYLLTPPDIIDPDILIPMVMEAVRAGADIIQLRSKGAPDREIVETGSMLCKAVREAGALFIVNDRIDIAIATGADGVHLGQDDIPMRWAERILGARRGEMIIGRSTHSIEQAMKAEAEGADYIGFGPVFPTSAKIGWPPVGTAMFPALDRETGIPWFAIGGIERGNIDRVIGGGASRVALSNGVFGKGDIGSEANFLKELLKARARGGDQV